MKVLVATPYLFPEGGGLERYAHAMGQRLARLGHEVVEIGHARGDVATDLDGIRRVALRPRARLSNTPVPWGVQKAAREELRAGGYDVVSVHTPVPGTAEAVALAARREGVPYVVTYHAGVLEGPGLLDLAAWAHRHSFERWMLARAAGRIAVSPFVADRVFGGGPSHVVPPGVDAARFTATREAERGRILFVGPVSKAYKWKGLSTLRDAFTRVAVARPEATLRVVGAGDLLPAYRRWARDHGLADRVTFAGRVDEAQLVDEYSAASVVALPSWSAAESFGMVLAEANACGRPVVASHVGGIPSFVRDGENGLLVPPRFATELANALETLLRDDALAREMGARGRARVLAEHRWEDLAERTGAILAEAAASRREPKRLAAARGRGAQQG